MTSTTAAGKEIYVGPARFTDCQSKNEGNDRSGEGKYSQCQYGTDEVLFSLRGHSLLPRVVETLQSFAKHRLVKPYIFDLPVKKVLEIQPGTYPGSIANKFTYTMEDVAGAPLENKDWTSSAFHQKSRCRRR